jgi:hypothetical protein
LWNFPSAFGSSRLQAFARLQQKLTSLLRQPLQWHNHKTGSEAGPGTTVEVPVSLARVRHSITHRRIHIDVYAARTGEEALLASIRWICFERVGSAAVSQLARKIAASVTNVVRQPGINQGDEWAGLGVPRGRKRGRIKPGFDAGKGDDSE